MIAIANTMSVFASVFQGRDFSTDPCLSIEGASNTDSPVLTVPPSRGLKISEGCFG